MRSSEYHSHSSYICINTAKSMTPPYSVRYMVVSYTLLAVCLIATVYHSLRPSLRLRLNSTSGHFMGQRVTGTDP